MNKPYFYKALIFCLCIYLCTLFYKLPASLLKPAFNNSLPLTIDTLSGTVWNGSISNLSVKIDKGFINIGQLHWQLKPACLFLLKACAELQLSPNALSQGDIYLHTHANASINKQLILKNTDTDIDATWLLEMAALPISAMGRITLQAELIKLHPDASLPTIFGELRWQKAAIDYPEEYELGNYMVNIETLDEDQGRMIQGLLTDENGLISSDGNIHISSDGQINLDIKLRSNAQTPDSLASILSLIGNPDSSGAYNIRHKTFLKTIF